MSQPANIITVQISKQDAMVARMTIGGASIKTIAAKTGMTPVNVRRARDRVTAAMQTATFNA